jgi:5-methylcytosine-specific restriction endonuclease McrA
MVVLLNGGQLGGPSNFCFYCGRRVHKWKQKMYERPPRDMITEDHVVPKSKGGTKTVTSCFGCNQDKFSLSLDEYRVLKAFRAGLVPLPEYKFAAEQRGGI